MQLTHEDFVRVSAVADEIPSLGPWRPVIADLATLLGTGADSSAARRARVHPQDALIASGRTSRTPPVQPFALCPPERLARCRGVLTDIDDTLTEHGVLMPEALAALHRLRELGLPTIAITGRPMGWSEPFARAWPVDAIVAENGAVALFREAGDLCIEYAQDDATRRANAQRLQEVLARIVHEVPGASAARDSAGRVTDIAIDHSEFVHLPGAAIERVVALMRSEGMEATVSSIHVNGWFGTHDKRSGARWIVSRLLGRELDAERDDWLYVGDSTNDQVMFGCFPMSVGVANLMRFAAELTVWPAYLAEGERGNGFAQVVEAIAAVRAQP